MKVSDIFRRSSDSVASGVRQTAQDTQSSSTAVNPAKVDGGSGDRVSISTEYRKFSQIASVVAQNEISSRSRIDELKDKIAKGEYKVDSKDIANAIVDFATEDGLAAVNQ